MNAYSIICFFCPRRDPNATPRPTSSEKAYPTSTYDLTSRPPRNKSASVDGTPTPEGTSVFSAEVVPYSTGEVVFP